MNNCHTIYAPPILAICEQPILIMSIWFGVLTWKGGHLNGMGGVVTDKRRTSKLRSNLWPLLLSSEISSFGLSTACICIFAYFRFRFRSDLFLFIFGLVLSWDFDQTYLGFERRGEVGERILRPKDYVIKSWQLETVGLLRYFEGNRINQDHNAF